MSRNDGQEQEPRPQGAVARLHAALLDIDDLHKQGKRDLLNDELRSRVHGYNASRHGDARADLLEVARYCHREAALADLLRAVESIVGETQRFVQELATLVGELSHGSMPVLNQDEVDRLTPLLMSLEGADASLSASSAQASTPEVIDLRTVNLGTGERDHQLAVLQFVESRAHEAQDRRTDTELHQAALLISQRLGLLNEYLDICRRLYGDTDQVPLTTDPSTTSPRVDEPGSEDDKKDDDMKRDLGPETLLPHQPPLIPALAPRIIGGLPARNRNFVGRDDVLTTLWRTLRQHPRATVVPQTLQGLGGIGKTQLAIEYAQRYLDEYELIFWIPAGDQTSIRRSFRSLARRLDLPESEDAEYTIESVREHLRLDRANRTWLLIFDGAESPAELNDYLPDSNGHVLITSRNRGWLTQPNVNVVPLDVFAPDEADDFLQRRWLGLTGDQRAVLAETLGYLPIALEQAAALHTTTGMQYEEYLQLFREDASRLLQQGSGSAHEPVAITWRLSFEQLSERSEAAAQLLVICSFLSTEAIFIPTLTRGRGAPLPEPIASTLRDEIRMRMAISDLGNFSLVSIDTQRNFLKIHPLVATFVRAELTVDARRTNREFAHQILAHANPGDPDVQSNWRHLAALTPHIIPSGLLDNTDTHVRRVALDVARHQFMIGNYRESADLAESAVSTWRKASGPDDESALLAMRHLGNAQRALGQHAEARDTNMRAMAGMRRVFGEEGEPTLALALSSGADLRLLADYEQAKQLDDRNVAACQRVVGSDDMLTLRARNNLAIDYRLLGRFTQAYEIDQDTAPRFAEIRGRQHPESLLFQLNLVRDLYGLGRYQEGLTLLEELQPANPRHPVTLLWRRTYVMMLRKVGRWGEAAQLAPALAMDTMERFGPRHSATLLALNTAMNALRIGDQLRQARETGTEAVELCRNLFGQSHPFTLACSTNRAIALRASGDVDAAMKLDLEAAEGLARSVGEDHPYTMCAQSNLANDYALTGAREEALRLTKSVLTRSRKVRGAEHPYTLFVAINHVQDLEAVGSHSDAATLKSATLDAFRRVLGANHEDTALAERGRRAESDTEPPPT